MLDKITSYKLVLYCLYAMLGWALIVSSFGKLPLNWYDIAASAAFLVAVAWTLGWALGRFLDIANNKESDLITALILALILSPGHSLNHFIILSGASIAAVASKYVLTIYRRHIFNPAAFGAFISGAIFHSYTSWWVGTSAITPVVVISAVLILRKMKRFTMVGMFILVYIASIVITSKSYGYDTHALWLGISATPLLFFASVMLIEPLTSPTAWPKYLSYVLVVGFFYSFTKFRISPEQSLLIGNGLAFVIAPYKRLRLKLVGRKREAEGIYSFAFSGKDKFQFQPGQYMEWTLPANQSDSRGNRRYLTISSSPGEKDLKISLKIPEQASSFKKRLMGLKGNDVILASQLAGSFTLPKTTDTKLVFVAGGIGITPFHSMIKSLADNGQKRPITLLYAANNPSEFAFTKTFKQAGHLGVRTVYAVTASQAVPGWHGPTGPVDDNLIKSAVPDYKQRTFYVSGPFGFVQSVTSALDKLELENYQVITDYFPGYG